jgi:hypothetical protein
MQDNNSVTNIDSLEDNNPLIVSQCPTISCVPTTLLVKLTQPRPGKSNVNDPLGTLLPCYQNTYKMITPNQPTNQPNLQYGTQNSSSRTKHLPDFPSNILMSLPRFDV